MEKWCPEYDCLNVGGDDAEYKQIIKEVKEEISQTCTLSLELFKKIYNWKAARAIHHVDFSKFGEAPSRSSAAIGSFISVHIRVIRVLFVGMNTIF
jgi:hypothetical protein